MSPTPIADLVLVHGGAHAADCWHPLIAELRRLAPNISVLAVDLPGRRGKPGTLATATIDEWETSIVADIERAGLKDVVICGHSMAGLTVPGVVSRLGAERVRELILISEFVPRFGQAIVDTLGGPLGLLARRLASRTRTAEVPKLIALYAFCNGMTRIQRQFTLRHLCAESIGLVTEPVDRRQLPDPVPRTWVMTTRDRALSTRSQRRSIEALGGDVAIIPMVACHDVMISHPDELAAILVSRCHSPA